MSASSSSAVCNACERERFQDGPNYEWDFRLEETSIAKRIRRALKTPRLNIEPSIASATAGSPAWSAWSHPS